MELDLTSPFDRIRTWIRYKIKSVILCLNKLKSFYELVWGRHLLTIKIFIFQYHCINLFIIINCQQLYMIEDPAKTGSRSTTVEQRLGLLSTPERVGGTTACLAEEGQWSGWTARGQPPLSGPRNSRHTLSSSPEKMLSHALQWSFHTLVSKVPVLWIQMHWIRIRIQNTGIGPILIQIKIQDYRVPIWRKKREFIFRILEKNVFLFQKSMFKF